MAKNHKRIMEQLKADVSEMLDNAKAVRGEAFAEAAYYSLTIAQILRIHALGTADRVDAGLISGARGETEGEAVCALVHELFKMYINASDIEAEEIDEAMEFGAKLVKKIQQYEESDS